MLTRLAPTVPSHPLHKRMARPLLVCLAVTVASISAVLALPVGSGTTWEVFDSSSTSTGFVVGTGTPSGFDWPYYAWNPNPPPPYTKAGQGTAQDVGDGNYEWTSQGGDTGTVTIDDDTGTWTNNTNNTSGTLNRL